MTRTRKDIMRRAEQLGLHVTTWSPGDGATRYRFSRLDLDYFALGGNNSFTALGVREAAAMLDAYGYGQMKVAEAVRNQLGRGEWDAARNR